MNLLFIVFQCLFSCTIFYSYIYRIIFIDSIIMLHLLVYFYTRFLLDINDGRMFLS